MTTADRSTLAETRHAQILGRLKEQGAVRVGALADELGVADETIRRDLDKLHRAGSLRRTHGGALKCDVLSVDPSLDERRVTHAAEKRAIARVARRLLDAKGLFDRPDPILALDASSTAMELARLLPDRPMTVLTNGVATTQALARLSEVKVITTGGVYDAAGACLVGPLAEATLGQFAVDLACISCRAVDPERGCSESSPEHAALKRAMVDAAERVVLLTDRSKLGRRAVSFFLGLDRLGEVVTDARPDDEAAAFLWTHGATVHVADGAAAE